jgi:DNA-binding response OmpR family regulator
MSDVGQYTIIVLDPNESRRRASSRSLHGPGYGTIEFSDRQRVFDAVRQETPALFVVTVNSSHFAEIELCRQIKAEATTAATVILQLWPSPVSGAAMSQMGAGADAYIIERSDAQDFLATAKVLLLLYSREAENRRLRLELRAEQDQLHAPVTASLNPLLPNPRLTAGNFLTTNSAPLSGRP